VTGGIPPRVATAPRSTTDNALQTLKRNAQEAKSRAEREYEQQQLQQQQEEQRSKMSIVPPLLSNKEFEEKYTSPPKKARFVNHRTALCLPDHPALPKDATPPLTSIPYPPIPQQQGVDPIKLLELPSAINDTITTTVTNDPINSLLRTHSLALSDFSHGDIQDLNEEFVNPFADESDIISKLENVPCATSRT